MHVFLFQAEDGIRDAQESRGLGDVYMRQVLFGEDEAQAKLQEYIESTQQISPNM